MNSASLGQPEVGAEARHRGARLVPAQGELDRLVLPTLLVEVEQGGEEPLGGMGEANLAGGRARGMVDAASVPCGDGCDSLAGGPRHLDYGGGGARG